MNVGAPLPLKFASSPAIGLVLGGIAALAMVMVAVVAPGCTGPASKTPCDYLEIANRALSSEGRRFSPHFPIQVLDWGSSVYLQQWSDPALGIILHTPGVVIDNKSCRVCQIDIADRFGSDHGLRILATYSAARPLEATELIAPSH